ncbi:MAG: O-antigen ligase family protein [Alphaproteobacteria bacterium]
MTDQARRFKEVFPRPPQVYVLAFGAAMFPLLALFAPTQIAAALLILGTLALILNPVTGFWPLKTQPYLLPLAVLLALGALSGIWAVEGAETWQRTGRLLSFLAAGILLLTHARELSRPDKRFICRALTVGFAVLAVLFVEERLAGKWLLYRTRDIDAYDAYAVLNQPGVLLALLSWPVGGFLWSGGRRGAALAVFLLTPLTMIGEAGKAGLAALVVGWLIFLPMLVMPRITRLAACLGIVVAAVGLPLAAGSPAVFETAYGALGPTAYGEKHRLVMWRFAGDRIAERPVFGWGLDSARVIPGGDMKVVDFPDIKTSTFVSESTREAMGESVVMQLHPHNAILQVQMELGLFGLVALVTFLVLTIRAASETGPPVIRACRMAMLTGAITVACISFGIWQSWWVASLFLLAAFGAALPGVPSRERQAREVPENSVVNPPKDDDEAEATP